MSTCKICGEYDCKKHSFLIGKTKQIKEFSGSSPPEIFVGKWNYPNVYAGILSPQEFGDTSILSSPEQWHKNKLQIPEILSFRDRLIYGRSKTHIKKNNQKFISVVQEVAMSHKSVSAEFKLKKSVTSHSEDENSIPLIKNAAEIDQITLQENPSIKPSVEYLVNDDHAKASTAILELDKVGIDNSSIIKLLSAGLLGLRKNRKLVPTRWSITAVDDMISKEKLKRIKIYPEISEIEVFHSEYLGNHYEFLLLPDKFSFEVIEISMEKMGIWKDHEFFNGRKEYAESVTGAYYANRLALTEYLEKIKRQAQCIVIRQITSEYSSPLGVGILRETSRDAFSKMPRKFNTLAEAKEDIQGRLKINLNEFLNRSILLKEYGKQKRLSQFF